MANNIEIERKLLVEMPDVEVLKKQSGYNASFIEQIYISLESNGEYVGDRIRKREYEFATKYYRTHKEDITKMSRLEIENEISAEEYNRLAVHRVEDSCIIRKVRHCFNYMNQLVEVDIYDFWSDKAVVEVEIEDEQQKVVLPDFIRVIEDVTMDKSYSNYSLSLSVKR